MYFNNENQVVCDSNTENQDDSDSYSPEAVDNSIILCGSQDDESPNEIQNISQGDSIYSLDWLEQSELYSDEMKKFIKENLQCQICLSLMKNVVELECQHILCEECFKKQRSYYSWENQCPFCKTPIERRNKQTIRSKTLNNLIRTLEIKCSNCSQDNKISIEESKDNCLDWEGQIQNLDEHLKIHNQFNIENNTTIKCSNAIFGCDKIFSNETCVINHTGTVCKYQWRRCGFCMKILPVYLLLNHNCDPQDFFNKIKIYPSETTIQQNCYQLNIILNCDCERFFEQLQKIFQITKVEIKSTSLQIKIDDEFIRENLLLCLKDTQFREKCQIVEYEESVTQEQRSKLIQNLSPKEKFLSYLSQRLDVFQRRLIQFNQVDRTINYEQARNCCYQHLTSSWGNIHRIDIFGKGNTGKFYGKIEYENEQAAKNMLEKVQDSNGVYEQNGFKCQIQKFIDSRQRMYD